MRVYMRFAYEFMSVCAYAHAHVCLLVLECVYKTLIKAEYCYHFTAATG